MEPTKRINVVDCLRGFAICGIIIIHFLEHMDFYSFPALTPLDKKVWDAVFFLGSNKMYEIFALLFGFSCYIMHHNQEKKGLDFRPRFAWRMFLLMLWAVLDVALYKGDILCTYALLGLFLIPLVKASDKVLMWVALFFFLQPVEIVYAVLGIINPSLAPLDLGTSELIPLFYAPLSDGNIIDVALVNIRIGFRNNISWAIEAGRLTQTFFLFVLGMLAGRKRLFINENGNLDFWKKLLWFSVAGFAVFYPMYVFIPDQIGIPAVSNAVRHMFNLWYSFAMTCFYVSGLVLLYYKTKAQNFINHFSYIGKMSLSCYIIQSFCGGFIFYNWGLGLYRVSGHTMSLCLAVGFLFILYGICRWWMTRHRRGPLEEIWSRSTFIGKDICSGHTEKFL